MYQLLILLLTGVVTGTVATPSSEQLVEYKRKHGGCCKILTTSAGSPIEYNEATKTLNKDLISNEYFMDSLTHVLRERIQERVAHPKGTGAFGYFKVTHDITNICKAKLFSKIGKKTPVVVRFSPAVIEKGGSDLSREPRGFAVKFYTEDGNFDIVGFNVPMFVIRDPVLFTTFMHILRRNPATNLYDANMFWNFVTLVPESLHMFLLVFGDRGIPDGYRYMPGFSIHTYQVFNECGETYFVRFHILPDEGIRNLHSDEARKIAGVDPDYANRDLYDAIGNGSYPSWTMSIQVLSMDDVKNAKFDVFDVTKVLPQDTYPLQPVGKIVLNENPINFFAEIEQLAFCPGNLVPGIPGAPDKIFESRRLAYRDTQNYRLGVNFNKIRVNCPMRNIPYTYNRDGKPPVKDNERDGPNYYPNSFNGPVPYKDKKRVDLLKIYENEPDNFDQARELYANEMAEDEQRRLVENIVNSLRGAVGFLQERAVELLTMIHPDLGNRVYRGLGMNGTVCN